MRPSGSNQNSPFLRKGSSWLMQILLACRYKASDNVSAVAGSHLLRMDRSDFSASDVAFARNAGVVASATRNRIAIRAADRQRRNAQPILCLQRPSRQGHSRKRCEQCAKERTKATIRAKHQPKTKTTHCLECGSALPVAVPPISRRGKKYCGRSCREKHGHKSACKNPKKCKGCGVEFLGRRRSIFHSNACRFAFVTAQRQSPEAIARRRDRDRAQTRKRRIRWAGAHHEPYKDSEIFGRDKWRCWICGKKVDRLMKFPDPKSASIDHVIPLSKGGDDAPYNVHCAHFGCNSSRNAKVTTLF